MAQIIIIIGVRTKVTYWTFWGSAKRPTPTDIIHKLITHSLIEPFSIYFLKKLKGEESLVYVVKLSSITTWRNVVSLVGEFIFIK